MVGHPLQEMGTRRHAEVAGRRRGLFRGRRGGHPPQHPAFCDQRERATRLTDSMDATAIDPQRLLDHARNRGQCLLGGARVERLGTKHGQAVDFRGALPGHAGFTLCD